MFWIVLLQVVNFNILKCQQVKLHRADIKVLISPYEQNHANIKEYTYSKLILCFVTIWKKNYKKPKFENCFLILICMI